MRKGSIGVEYGLELGFEQGLPWPCDRGSGQCHERSSYGMLSLCTILYISVQKPNIVAGALIEAGARGPIL